MKLEFCIYLIRHTAWRLGIWSAMLFGGLGFTEVLVFQYGDTLKFSRNDSVIDQLVMSSRYQEEPEKIQFTQKAKVAPDNRSFFVYEETYFPGCDSYVTEITVFRSDRKKIMEYKKKTGRRFVYDLTNIYGSDMLILGSTDFMNGEPLLCLINSGKKEIICEKNMFQRIVHYSVSDNRQYIVLHVKNPHGSKSWDYIYFIDLKTKGHWEYPYPYCFSCKRGWIDLKVDNEGQVEVTHKREHRFFTKDGQLVDIRIGE